ncbi:hypothetical protein [Methanospirillum sp.]|nr:hypothetical protein [Methanospirillum sp.]HPP79200.1 hypothetical protein [Methanospirillum sp.]
MRHDRYYDWYSQTKHPVLSDRLMRTDGMVHVVFSLTALSGL